MNGFYLKILLGLGMALLSFTSVAHHQPRTVFDVGVLALRGHSHARETWQPTLDWLALKNPDFHFNLHTYDFDQLEEAFLHNRLDFILTSPGQATRLAREYPIHWLATQKTELSENPRRSIASVVVVRQESAYQNLKDIEQAHIVAVSEKAFGGFLALRYELDKLGYYNSRFFNNLEFKGPPTDNLIHDLVEKQADVAIVPACTLENMVKEGKLEKHNLRILNPSRPENSVCTVSTPLYPNWTLAMTDRAPMQVCQQVAQSLFDMPSDHIAAQAAQNKGWILPASSVKVDKVFQHLDLHPLQKPLSQRFTEWFYRNQTVTIASILTFILLTGYHFWLQWRFKRSRAELRDTLNDLRQKSAILEHVQRTTIVGELGSSLAHELNQPLAAIKNYSQGVQLRMQNGTSPDALMPIMQKIQHQVRAASDIIQRLRSLIHKQPIQKSWVDLPQLIEESLKLVDYDFQRHGIELAVLYSGEGQAIYVDAIGVQQVLLNLLTNSKDACLSVDDRNQQFYVDVHVSFCDDQVILDITDNGIGLSAPNETIQQAFYTTKSDGLGLGLAICRDVIEAHQGQLYLRSLPPRGCQATIILPYLENNHVS